MDSHDMNIAIDRLKSGESIQRICSFYAIDVKDLDAEAKKRGFNDIKQLIYISNSAKNKRKIKPRDGRILSVAEHYVKKGKSFEQFLNDLKASQRPFSDEQIEMARNVFKITNGEYTKKKNIKDEEMEM